MKALQGQGELLRELKLQLSQSSHFFIATALITESGLDLLSAAIEGCLRKGGEGCVLFGVDLPTEPAAIRRLSTMEAHHKQSFTLRRFQPGRTFFHPKLSIFVGRTSAKKAIVGSSNLTAGGLDTNYETNVLIDQSQVVNRLLDYFNEQFLGAHSRRADQRWLDQYEQLWRERKWIEQQQRKLREQARHLGGPPANIPRRIRGHVFAFTGAIAGWPRDRKLYPRVKKMGGAIAAKAGGMNSADCLVHGEILDGRKSTQKLTIAHQRKIPIITEEQFFKLARINGPRGPSIS